MPTEARWVRKRHGKTGSGTVRFVVAYHCQVRKLTKKTAVMRRSGHTKVEPKENPADVCWRAVVNGTVIPRSIVPPSTSNLLNRLVNDSFVRFAIGSRDNRLGKTKNIMVPAKAMTGRLNYFN
jgi:hypothetical protein